MNTLDFSYICLINQLQFVICKRDFNILDKQFLVNFIATLVLSRDIILSVDPTFKYVPHQIRNDNQYHLYFKDCIGAIIGTHVKIIVPSEHQTPYTCRKRFTSTNDMDVYDFNMCFTFGLTSAHDTKIFMDALHIRLCNVTS